MACTKHEGHTHTHGTGCGHIAVKHNGHIDYLHDGHLHYVHGDHVDDHVLEASTRNQSACTPIMRVPSTTKATSINRAVDMSAFRTATMSIISSVVICTTL